MTNVDMLKCNICCNQPKDELRMGEMSSEERGEGMLRDG